MDATELAHLWILFKETQKVEVRNQLFQHYSEWVRKVTSIQFAKYGNQLVDWSDCMQNASIALIEAIERFDIERGVPFEAFAYPRTKGAILNGIVRFQREKSQVAVQDSDMECVLDRECVVDMEEGEDFFDVFVDSVIDLAFSKMLDMASYRSRQSSQNPLDLYLAIAEEDRLTALVAQLPADLAFIINAHYNHYLSFVQIAEKMNLSRSRISQLHKEALRKLRLLYESN